MSSEDYKESEMSKIVKRLMDEEGFEFGEAVKEAMEQTKRFESKADGGSIGIEVLFTDKMANGGRAGYVSGGAALKLLEKGKEGIESLYNVGKSIFSKGDDAVDLAKQEEIFRSGNITTDFLENVDDKVIKKFVETRDAKGPGGYGLYDSFDDMPNGLKAAELISRIKNADGGIDYEAAELFIGKKLKGNETVNELISMVVTEKKADGGRVGLFMGGDPLTGQALAIYNSMSAYGAGDQEIADRLQSLGYYDPNASTPDPTPDTGQTIGYQGGSDNFSPYNPDPNKIQSFKTDPIIAAANEADVRTKQLTSMGINDPFANEASLSGAYYGDMPEDTSNQIGKQSMFAKAKQGLTGLMDNPITSAIGFAMNPAFGAIKGIAKGIGSMIPVNQRAIQENIMGNLGFAVNDIGQIVSTGDYDDPSNVMAGYNLNKMTPQTFMKRIDMINKNLQLGKYKNEDAMRKRLAAIEEAKRKFELAEKLKAEELAAKQLSKTKDMAQSNKESGKGGYQSSWGGGGGAGGDGGGFMGGSGTAEDMGSFAKGGRVGYQAGGVATPEQYAKALQQVGAGSALDKLRSTGDYVKNYVSNVGQSVLNKNPAIRGIASFYGVGKPISSFSDFSSGSQQAIKDAEAAQAALDNAVRTGRRPGSGSGPTTKDDGGGSAGTGGYSYDAGGREGFGYGLADGGRVYLYNRLK